MQRFVLAGARTRVGVPGAYRSDFADELTFLEEIVCLSLKDVEEPSACCWMYTCGSGPEMVDESFIVVELLAF